MFFVFLLYALFASVFTISKTGLQYAQPIFFVGSRMLLAGIIMLVYQYSFRRKEFKFQSIHFWKICRLAIFNIYLTNVFEFWGLKYLSSFKACFIYSLSPFLSALISYLVCEEKMSPKKWLGLAVGLVGVLPLLLNETTTEEESGRFLFMSWAEVALLFAVVCSVYGWILLRQLVADHGYVPLMANGLSMAIGGSMALLHSLCVEDWHPIPVVNFFPFFECALLLIIISNLICYNLYGVLLKQYSATFMSFAGFTTPIFTAIFGWFYLGETVTWPFYLSMSIVFSGLFVFYQEELRVIAHQKSNQRPELLAE